MAIQTHIPWNKGHIIGQKKPLKISHIWGIRIRLELEKQTRDLAIFNLGLDSKLRGCDLVKLKVSDVICGYSVLRRAHVVQQKTGSPVQFEITPKTGESILAWVKEAELKASDYLFKSRIHSAEHISTLSSLLLWGKAVFRETFCEIWVRRAMQNSAKFPRNLGVLKGFRWAETVLNRSSLQVATLMTHVEHSELRD